MNFLNYVKQRRVTDDPAGDFVMDAKTDPDFPDARTWREVEAYLWRRRACAEAVDAGRVVWRGYAAGHTPSGGRPIHGTSRYGISWRRPRTIPNIG